MSIKKGKACLLACNNGAAKIGDLRGVGEINHRVCHGCGRSSWDSDSPK